MERIEQLHSDLSGTRRVLIKRRLVAQSIDVLRKGAYKVLTVPVYQQKVVGAYFSTRFYPETKLKVLLRFQGVGPQDQDNGSFVASLPYLPITKRYGSITITSGENQHIYLATPVEAGMPTLEVNGVEGGWKDVKTVEVENPVTQALQMYYLFESLHDNLGTVTINIS